jgi:hypothetical protein
MELTFPSIPWAMCLVLIFTAQCFGQTRRAQPSWWDRSVEAKVGHYWIKTDLPADEANALARHLNIMYGEYSRRLARLPVRAQEKLNVMIFQDRIDYQLTLRARFGINPGNSGGIFFVTRSATALAFWTGDLSRRRVEHVIQHEGFHQFAYSRFGDDLPMWVNEGLAELFGEAVVIGDQVLLGQSTPRVINAIKSAIETNSSIPFDQMLSMSSKQWSESLSTDRAALNYHQAWSMIHFLIYGEGGKYVNLFDLYLKHLNNGLPSHEAFKRAFGDDVPGFERLWKQYALRARPSALATALERMEFLAEGLLELGYLKIYPETLDALKDALREIKFTYSTNTHGAVETKLSAFDDSMYQIPPDEFTVEQPVFRLSRARPAQYSARERALEAANPMPPVITTEHLKPRELAIQWLRKMDNSLRYEIVAK